MRLIGFSTGALAQGDFGAAVQMLLDAHVNAIEISALRAHELPQLLAAAPTLPLSTFRHVSVHAPSQFPSIQEGRVIGQLERLIDRGWPIVVHPDVIYSVDAWRALGSFLWVENMDKRKAVGRSATELTAIFDELPDAGLCLDLAHARQLDPSMLEAYRILREHSTRLRQVHLSELGSNSKHGPLSFGAIHDYAQLSASIAPEVPIILESAVPSSAILSEISYARDALPQYLPVTA